MRTIILHYHLFKNAGSSVDAILRKNFPDQLLTTEFKEINNHKAVARWIAANPEGIAFSSHSAQLPLPIVEGVRVFPIVFVRHPLDRIWSSYLFAKRQDFDAPHVHLARNLDLAGYLRFRLDDRRDRQCRNHQTLRLSRYGRRMGDRELAGAMEALEGLPLVGVVEDFDLSLRQLQRLLRAWFPLFEAFPAHENASRAANSSLAARLESFRQEIGDPLYNELLAANADDLALHRAAIARLRHNADPQKKGGNAAVSNPA
jgi:hypothetical protein